MLVATAERSWAPGRPVDIVATVGPLCRGSADPAHRIDADGTFWWACRTPDGPGTLAVRPEGGAAHATAWGRGAGWLLDRVPRLLGDRDDWSGLRLDMHPHLRDVLRRRPGLRLASTGLVLDSLVPAILEQRVTGGEARRSWRGLLYRVGESAPGPMSALRVPPDASTLLDVPAWTWHRLGVDLQRHRAIRAAATVANRLEEAAKLPPDAALARLRLVPGIGAWTAAETVQRAFGDPDAVSVGDFHIPNLVSYALAGVPRGSDELMLRLLEPWFGQRQRVVRLIEFSGIRPPRFGPRLAVNDIRGI